MEQSFTVHFLYGERKRELLKYKQTLETRENRMIVLARKFEFLVFVFVLSSRVESFG